MCQRRGKLVFSWLLLGDSNSLTPGLVSTQAIYPYRREQLHITRASLPILVYLASGITPFFHPLPSPEGY